MTVTLSTTWVAPAASLANQWDTRMGGALADAISCNAVVKGFGAEDREESRLKLVVDKWRKRTSRTWNRGTLNGTIQNAMLLVLRAAIIGAGLLLWQQGAASAGDITFVLTTFFVLQGYLRDVGQHVRNLQRSVNDMEELVRPRTTRSSASRTRPGAKPIAIEAGGIAFEHVDFHYGAHATPLYDDLSVTIAPGERVGLVGHSGSGKTTFVKLIQRLYDVSGGRIAIDGQDIRDVHAGLAAPADRDRAAGAGAVPPLAGREHRLWQARRQPRRDRSRRRSSPTRMISSSGCPRATRRWWASAASSCRAASGSASPSPGRSSPMRRVLILDEATSSLDSESELLIQEAMERLMVGRTTIVIAHRLSTVRALDRLLVFDAGKIVEEGTHEQLVKRPAGIYRRLFERQALELTKGLEAAE